MEMIMGAKDAVRALLDRLPDDCKLDDVIEQITLLDGPWLDEADRPHHIYHGSPIRGLT